MERNKIKLLQFEAQKKAMDYPITGMSLREVMGKGVRRSSRYDHEAAPFGIVGDTD